MKFSNLAALLAVVLLPVSWSLAGPPPSLEADGPSTTERVTRMTEALSLTDAQADRIEEILVDAQERGRALRPDLRASYESLQGAVESGDEKEIKQALKRVDDNRQELEALRDVRDEIRAELDLVQQAKFELLDMRRNHQRRQAVERVRDGRENRAE